MVRDKNISFAFRDEEKCEICLQGDNYSHLESEGVKTNIETCNVCRKWNDHIDSAKDARKEYERDRDIHNDLSQDILYLSSDMQKVIVLPQMRGVKDCFFTKGLVVFHQTFAPLGATKSKARAKRTLAVLWHEGVSGIIAADLSSVYDIALRHFSESFDNIVIWADNCAAQIKNWTLFSTLHCLVNDPSSSTDEIQIKYFEKGAFIYVRRFLSRICGKKILPM